ncbi:MAG TPA: hypothetical protein ENK89_03955, partial [Desulfobulbaceae bacterium]|nr:hypothetical protein [Desulfobulbaceae bacterium]
MLVIDGGATFFAHPYLSPTQLEPARRTAEGIGQAMAEMRTRAIGVSPYDLAAGTDFLVQLAKKDNLSLLSANLYEKKGNKPIFRPYLLTKAGNMTIALIGLTGALPGNRPHRQLHILPWQQVLPGVLREIDDKADLIILLSSAPPRTNEEIARKFRKIHIILQSGQGNGNQPPVNINNTLLCQTASRGKSLGILNINWNPSKVWSDHNPDLLKNTQSRLDRIRWQIGRMQKRHQPEELRNNLQYQQLIQGEKELQQKISKLQQQKNDASGSLCRFQNTFIAMETSIPEDKAVKAIVDRTRRDVNKINRKRQQELRQRREKQRQTTNTQQAGPLANMAGSRICKKCHPAQVARYLQTDHAGAWKTLVDKDQQYNPDCIACHVTLPNYEQKLTGREELLTNIPARLQGVGCESCHGPALKHSLDP